jgi:hypothetical protein
MRRLPGHAGWRLSKGSHTPEALSELFRGWQRTQTNSIIRKRLFRVRGSKWMSGPAGMQGPPAVRHLCAADNPDPQSARSPERALRLRVFS